MWNKDISGKEIEYVDKNGKIYNTTFTFKKDAITEKIMAGLFKRRVICKKKEHNRYEQLIEE